MVMNQRLPLHASFNGSGLILTYLVVLAIEACPISLLNRQASMPPFACMVPVVCRRQCGCTGHVIFAFCPAVAIILLMANREKAWPRSLVEDVWSPGLLNVESCERVSASGGSVVLLVSGLRTVYLPCRSAFAHSFAS